MRTTEKIAVVGRNTRQKEAVLRAVLDSSDHPDAETVYERVKARLPNISLGTVYRNLTQLSEAGDVLRIPVSGGSDRFDKTLKTHIHFYCTVCRAVTDIDCGSLAETVAERIKSGADGVVTETEILCRGICGKCVKELK